MAKHKTSLLVTITTDEPVKPSVAAKLVRRELPGDYLGKESFAVTKVTVTHVGEV